MSKKDEWVNKKRHAVARDQNRKNKQKRMVSGEQGAKQARKKNERTKTKRKGFVQPEDSETIFFRHKEGDSKGADVREKHNPFFKGVMQKKGKGGQKKDDTRPAENRSCREWKIEGTKRGRGKGREKGNTKKIENRIFAPNKRGFLTGAKMEIKTTDKKGDRGEASRKKGGDSRTGG